MLGQEWGSWGRSGGAGAHQGEWGWGSSAAVSPAEPRQQRHCGAPRHAGCGSCAPGAWASPGSCCAGSPWGAQGHAPNTLQTGSTAANPRTGTRGSPPWCPRGFCLPAPQTQLRLLGSCPTPHPRRPRWQRARGSCSFPQPHSAWGRSQGRVCCRKPERTGAERREAAVALILPAGEEPEQGGLIKTIPWGDGAAEIQGSWRQGGRRAWAAAREPPAALPPPARPCVPTSPGCCCPVLGLRCPPGLSLCCVPVVPRSS